MHIDSHQHFWIYDAVAFPWIGPGMGRLARDYLPADLAATLAAAGISGSVAVQARQSIEETQWLLGLAERNPWIRGVVGWVDLQSPAVSDQLRRFAAHPQFVGVRHVVQDEPNPRFVLGEEFRRGIGALREWGLTYDLLLYPHQLPAAVELAGLTPEQPYVLYHLAKPAIRARQREPWRTDIAALARHEHVYCKLSGMVTEATLDRWRREDFRPYLEIAVDAFGPSRLMFGSDWPVCLLAAEYAEVLGIVTDFIAGLAPGEQEMILGGTAMRFYGLDR